MARLSLSTARANLEAAESSTIRAVFGKSTGEIGENALRRIQGLKKRKEAPKPTVPQDAPDVPKPPEAAGPPEVARPLGAPEHIQSSSSIAVPRPVDPPQPAEAPGVWETIQAETGFSSYESYISKHVQEWPQFKALLEVIQNLHEEEEKSGLQRSDKVRRSGCYYIFEAHSDGSLVKSNSYDGALDKGQATTILKHVRHTKEDILSRFVFVEVPGDNDLPIAFIDALGLGLRLDPRMFMAFIRRKTVDRLSSVFGNATSARLHAAMSDPFDLDFITEPQPLKPTFVAMGPFVLTYAEEFSERSNLPPVLLILGYAQLDRRFSIDIGLEVQQTPLFRADVEDEVEDLWSWPLLTASYLKANLARSVAPEPNRQSFPLCWITAFGQLQLAFLKSYCRRTRSEYLRLNLCEDLLPSGSPEKNTRAQHMSEWLWLRRSISDAEDGFAQLRNLGTDILGASLDQYDSFKELQTRLSSVIQESMRLESEIKDYLQFQVGDLSLEESRRSIALSNIQIEEAKRGQFLVSC